MIERHQQDAFDKLSKLKVGALFSSPGTGKTRMLVLLANSFKDEIHNIIYFAPVGLLRRGAIQTEIFKWGGFNAKCEYVGIESVQMSDRIFVKYYNKINDNTLLIVDESSKIKNSSALRTKKFIEYSKLTDYKLIANGTPISNSVMDLYTQLQFLSPKILNMSYYQFKNNFTEYTQIVNSRKVIREIIHSYHNLEYLFALIEPYIVYFNLLPKVGIEFYDHSYNVTDSDNYNRIKEEYLKLYESGLYSNFFLEMTQKLQHSYCIDANKIQLVKYFADNNTIIFTKFIKSYEFCKKQFPDALVLSLQKDALGLNLQKYSKIIFFDKTWDWMLREQAISRVFRYGQTNNVTVIDITANTGLDKLINDNITRKDNLIAHLNKLNYDELKDLL